MLQCWESRGYLARSIMHITVRLILEVGGG